ncbi:hypothetical protein [Halobacterium yunchengense]|uniref:hypothetical protein n=1 Tax=Halobacterium yunchengense TaxID=3108497 RepID=UPI00300A3C07
MRRVVAAVVVLLVAVPVAGGALAGPAPTAVADEADASASATGSAVESTTDRARAAQRATGARDGPTIEKHVRLFLTPDRPGEVDVEVTYQVPDGVSRLEVNVPGDAREVESAAFTATDGAYEWDGETDPAVLSFSLPANQSATGARSPSVAQDGQYAFVDTGPWAVVRVPGLQTGWSYRGSKPTLEQEVSVGGEGSTGGEIAYLGPGETYTRTANGQEFTLAVPDSADLAAPPGEILDALAAAAGRFDVGARDDEVWFVAAPAGADWGVRGVEYGGTDAWVLADSPLDEPGNVWFHEYVHTRQAFDTASSGRWVTEAAAEYYSALLALRTGYVDFEAFETYLSYGEREPWRSAVLASPSTWAGGANYVKGSLVWGAVDRRVRLATNSSATMADVFYRLNERDDRVTNADVLAAVDDAAGPAVADYGRRYTETDRVPSMWSRGEHAEAFGTAPPRMTYEHTEFVVEGPFRNETFSSPPTLYVGETLTVASSVTNEGGRTGEYSAGVSLDGRSLASASGDLAPGESEGLSVGNALEEPGTYEIAVGRSTTDVTVREPASVAVDSLSVSTENPRTGENVTVTLALSNPTDAYAAGPVDVTVDGETVASVEAALAPGASTTRSLSVRMDAGGSRQVAAGGESVAVRVGVASGGDGGTDTEIPGFGAAVAAVAVLAAAALAGRG